MDKVDRFIKNPKKALFVLAGPVIVGMLVQTLYNIVDTAFVGRIGADALAGITFSFPLFFILIALNAGIGSGVSSRIARYLGEKNKEAAENTALHGMMISIILSFIISIVGYFALKPVLMLFGASGNVLQFSIDYMMIILYGTLFLFLVNSFSSIFNGQGDTRTPMTVQVVALFINMALDYVFIMRLGWGIKGAAYATIISFFIAFLMYLFYMRRSSLKIHISVFRFNPKILRDIVSVGFPASVMMLLISIYVIFINRFMVHFSDNHVAAFGVAARLESVAMLPIVGLGIALITLVGMFYGSGRIDLVKRISIFSIKIGIIFAVIMGAVFFIFLKQIFFVFTSDPDVIALGIRYMRIDVLTFPLMAISVMSSRIMQGLGLGKPGLIINIVRVFVVAVPVGYLSIFVWDLDFVWVAWAGVSGGIAAAATGLIWLFYEFNKKKKDNQI